MQSLLPGAAVNEFPEKTLNPFAENIIQYSIEAALNSGIFDEVMVSTDDAEIASLSRHLGANIPFLRSAKASDDYATTSDVLTEVLNEYKSIGSEFDYLCCIYPTAPFVTAKKLQIAMQLLMETSDIDAVIPVVKFSFPPQRSFILKNKEVSILYPETFSSRSQDLEPLYHDCGQYYCVKVKSFVQKQQLILPHTLPIITPELEVQDIDDISDWEIAELKYIKMLQKKE